MKNPKDPLVAWRKSIGKHYNQQQNTFNRYKIKRRKSGFIPNIDLLATFEARWQSWSKVEKIAFITLVLILAGASLIVIHYIVKDYIARLDQIAKSPIRNPILDSKFNRKSSVFTRKAEASSVYDRAGVFTNAITGNKYHRDRAQQHITDQCVNANPNATSFLSPLANSIVEITPPDCAAITLARTTCIAVYPSKDNSEEYSFSVTFFPFKSILQKPELTIDSSIYLNNSDGSFVGLAQPFFHAQNMTQPLLNRAQKLLHIRAQIMQRISPQSINNLIAKLPIVYNTTLFENNCVTERQLHEYATQLRSQVAYAFNEELLTLAMTDSAIKIEIVPNIKFLKNEDEANGAYEFKSHKILFKYQPGISNDDMRKILSNEFSHFMTHYTNRLLCQNNNPSIAAVLDTDCQFDNRLHEAAGMALLDGLLRVRAYIDLIIQYRTGVQLTTTGKRLLEKFLDACQSYEPYEYVDKLDLSLEDLKTKYLHQNNDGQLYLNIDNHSYQVQYKYYISDINTVNGVLTLKGKHVPNKPTLLEKAWAFICYHENKMEAVHTGEYGRHPGEQPDPELLIGEAYSVFDTYPESLKKLLFPEICYYLSHYHAVEDYCHNRYTS